MDDSPGMGRLQGRGDLNTNVQKFIEGNWSFANSLLEVRAFEQLHDDHGLVVVFFHFIDRADIGVVQRRSGSGLALEALQRAGIASEVLRHEFQSHSTSQAEILPLRKRLPYRLYRFGTGSCSARWFGQASEPSSLARGFTGEAYVKCGRFEEALCLAVAGQQTFQFRTQGRVA